MQEFCSQLSKADVGGRSVCVTLARFHEYNNRLIGCSPGFLELTGRPRKDVMGMNCRFLNHGVDMPSSIRERLHDCVLTGVPFIGILKNKRYVGNGRWEIFDNLLHMVVVSVGVRSYIIGMQVNVTGLDYNLAPGSQDASHLQLMFDSVLSSGVDSWINFQDQEFQMAPVYLYTGPAGDGDDQVEILEEQCLASKWAVQRVPDRNPVLVHPFLPLDSLRDTRSRKGDQPSNHAKGLDAACLYEDASTEFPGSGNDASNGASDRTGSRSVSPPPLSPNEQTSTEIANMDMGIPTMKNQLQALDSEDPATVIIARGISKLGLSADETLRHFFAKFGNIKAVHIPHTFKKKAKKRNSCEPRAPGRCFIVMSTQEERAKIFAEATQYLVQGVEVTLEAFSAKPSQ